MKAVVLLFFFVRRNQKIILRHWQDLILHKCDVLSISENDFFHEIKQQQNHKKSQITKESNKNT